MWMVYNKYRPTDAIQYLDKDTARHQCRYYRSFDDEYLVEEVTEEEYAAWLLLKTLSAPAYAEPRLMPSYATKQYVDSMQLSTNSE